MNVEMSCGEKMNEFFDAFSKAQSEINNVLADKQGYNYKYAELWQVLAVIRKPFADNGLAIMQFPSSSKDSDGVTSTFLTTMITHKSGEWVKSSMNIDLPSADNKTTAIQKLGSHISYARRYMASAIAGVSQVDDESKLISDESAPATQKQKAIEESKKLSDKILNTAIAYIAKATTINEVDSHNQRLDKYEKTEAQINAINAAVEARKIELSQEAFNDA